MREKTYHLELNRTMHRSREIMMNAERRRLRPRLDKAIRDSFTPLVRFAVLFL